MLGDVDKGLAGGDGFGDEGEDLGADVGPDGVGGFGDCYKVLAVKDRGDAVDVHEVSGEGGRVWGGDGGAGGEVFYEGGGDGLGEDGVVGEEFEGVGVGGWFGLDEDGALRLLGRGYCWVP